MKTMISALMLALNAAPIPAAEPPPLTVIEGVAVQNELREEAVHYFRHNWGALRAQALGRGFIDSYEMLLLPPQAGAGFDILLITRYANEEQMQLAEERFQGLIAASGGLDLLNESRPASFRRSVFSVVGTSLASPDDD